MSTADKAESSKSAASETASAAAGKTEPRGFREGLRYWLSVIPGTKRDYFLITLAVLDSLVILFGTNLIALFPFALTGAIVTFDLAVVAIWAIFFLTRLRKEKERWNYISYHWYEVIGMVPVPLSLLRFFLLLRAAKLVIAYYKLGRADQDVSLLLTRDLTFRFRDAIVDTIADAVFMQSLSRVEEVMSRLDYESVARKAMSRHREDLRTAVADTLRKSTMIGELRKIPLMGGVADGLTNDVGLVVAEIFERKVVADILEDVAASVLGAMHTRLRDLGVERIVPTEPDASEDADQNSQPQPQEIEIESQSGKGQPGPT